MPAPRLPIRQRHLVPVALVIAIAMLSYFAHLVSMAMERAGERRATPLASAQAAPAAALTPVTLDETDTIAFAPHTVSVRP